MEDFTKVPRGKFFGSTTQFTNYTMKKILSAIAIASSAIFSAHGALVYTTFDIPVGSSNVGTFTTNYEKINSVGSLSQSGAYDYNYAYAYRTFTPSVTGTYTLGVTDADYDPVMILYSGRTSLSQYTAGTGAIAVNDDGNWDWFGSYWGYGTQVNTATPYPLNMPLLKNITLTAGTDYLVAIAGYRPYSSTEVGAYTIGPSSIPLPADFFVAGPASVTLDGAPAAVPEPGQVAASLVLLAGIAGYVFLKRRQQKQTAVVVA